MIKLYLTKTFALLFLLLGINVAWAQTRVTGKVTSLEDGTGLPGVSILEKGTTNGTVTDVNGDYSISTGENATLVFSFVGFTTQEVPVANQSTLDVKLGSDVTTLGEVVVIGYGEQKKEDLTGAVTAIGTKDFNRSVVNSPQDLIVGRVAGVQVISNSGAPGTGSTIRIRGGSSVTASNDPLIIIDGFPVDNSEVKGMSNPLASINPNDIESFTVLKDASATAIYGSRASNGVIIVTTKKGKAGKPQINYNGTFSISKPTQFIDVLNGDEYRALTAELVEAGSVSGLNEASLARQGTANTDWQDEIYQDAFSQDHNVNVAGSIKKVPFRFSYGYTDQEGILKTTDMKRNTLSLNLNPVLLDDHLKINASVKYVNSKTDFGNTGAVGAAVSFDPTQPVQNGNTRYGGYFTWVNLDQTLPDGSMDPNGNPNTFSINNPVALLEYTDNRSDVNRTIGTLQLDYRLPFLPALRANVNVGLDYSDSKGINNTAPEGAWIYRNYTTGTGELIDYTGTNQSKVFDFYLNYLKEFGKHKVDVTAGYSWQHFERDGTNYQRSGDETPIVRDNSAFANENFLVSFFGRVNYTFNGKYMLTATLRNDGSSRFSEENRWGLFPAVAAAWRIKDEQFLTSATVLSDLKLRASYGVTGQQDIPGGYYPYLPVYRQSIGGASYQFGNQFVPTLRPDPYDANIRWEETTTYDLGLDIGFFNDRLTASVDVYKRETEDLINNVPIANGSNFSNYLTTNVGNLENKGIEVTLNARPVETPDFTWNIGFNLTHNKNKITKLTLTDDPSYVGVNTGGISGGVGNNIQIHTVGYPANSFFVFEQVYGTDGIPIEGLYVDRTGSGGSVASNNLNKYHYHSPAPNVLMGLNSSVRYKQIDFAFSGRFSLDNYVYNNILSGSTYSSIYVQSGFFGNVLTDLQKVQFANPQYWSDHFVEDASFFKMDNISIGYNFDQLQAKKLKARLSFTVQNAFIITDYSGLDPEVNNTTLQNGIVQSNPGIDNNIYPRPRVFLLGVSLTY
ncbi:MAG TPA: TonB-dependent receptor [Chryseolinea sp.]